MRRLRRLPVWWARAACLVVLTVTVSAAVLSPGVKSAVIAVILNLVAATIAALASEWRRSSRLEEPIANRGMIEWLAQHLQRDADSVYTEVERVVARYRR